MYFDSTKQDDMIDNDTILVLGAERRVITGADILGRLLRGALRRGPEAYPSTVAARFPKPHTTTRVASRDTPATRSW